MTGYLLVNKPVGHTSHDVVAVLRRITRERRIGHAGTLDPFATGLLLVAVGREATKHLQEFVGCDKTYEATFVLGATTETLDPEAEVVPGPVPNVSTEQLREAVNSFLGDIEQIPPMYSAIKMKGKKLYELAREGKVVDRPPRAVRIERFDVVAQRTVGDLVEVDVVIRCSSGTYIRALARDLAEKLGTTGYTLALKRTYIANASVENAQALSVYTSENWLTFLKSLDEIRLTLGKSV